ncbi:hypothetical protein J3L16_03920 [Alteromonas sp. 5E99-2]|uniref:hypothetical protein n=1 Tax=Alteromonas sp. 5E99-2 TaxID=2817683 RepID=UPI001A980C34|nr:hypothetical protein [Alteromonas sp. 5E99-2]MBO1254835.1 hypothetical protein [Alteromonas sp. 5E99-2]
MDKEPLKVKSFVKLAAILFIVLVTLFVASIFFANKKVATQVEPYRPWWETLEPDAVVGEKNYYSRSCSLVELDTQSEHPLPETIFKPPIRLIASCRGSDLIINKNGYLIFSVCRVDFGGGGCGKERYRSSDMVHWQEDIGTTWIKGEQYTAWRELGSTSSKADAVSRVE